MVRAGDRFTFDISGIAGGWTFTTIDAVQADIAAQLRTHFDLQTLTVDAGGSFYELMQWPFRAIVNLTVREAHNAVNDVSAVVAHDVYLATGYLPSVSATSAGQPAQTPREGAIPDIPGMIGDAIKKITKPATDEFNFLFLGVAVVAIVLVVYVGGRTTRVGVAA
jgi:hypothetical protein